jgi:hypothetical protein
VVTLAFLVGDCCFRRRFRSSLSRRGRSGRRASVQLSIGGIAIVVTTAMAKMIVNKSWLSAHRQTERGDHNVGRAAGIHPQMRASGSRHGTPHEVHLAHDHRDDLDRGDPLRSAERQRWD